VFIACCVAACTKPPAARVESTTHVGSGFLHATLAQVPGGPKTAEAGGSLGLLLETRSVNGATWRRVITSDGSYGWTATEPSKLYEGVIRPALDHFVLLQQNPDRGPVETSPQVNPATASGAVTGASESSHPPSMEAMRVPGRLSPNVLPWLHLRFGDVSGYAPLAWVAIDWANEKRDPSPSLEAVIRSLDVKGIVIKPFLGPIRETLAHAGPAAGSSLFVYLDATTPLNPAQVYSNWQDAEILVRPSDAAGPALLVVYGKARDRLFMFHGSSGSVLQVLAEAESAYPSHVETPDLNSDGNADWALEVVSTFGDGFYSTLWVVDGSSGETAPKFNSVPLSRSSGEADGDVAATWHVDAENQLWVMRADEKKNACTCYQYSNSKLVPCPTARKIALVALAESKSYAIARQAWLSFRPEHGVALFAIRRDSGLLWIVAKPFLNAAKAREWSKDRPNANVIVP
jgi:hypothetical protein